MELLSQGQVGLAVPYKLVFLQPRPSPTGFSLSCSLSLSLPLALSLPLSLSLSLSDFLSLSLPLSLSLSISLSISASCSIGFSDMHPHGHLGHFVDFPFSTLPVSLTPFSLSLSLSLPLSCPYLILCQVPLTELEGALNRLRSLPSSVVSPTGSILDRFAYMCSAGLLRFMHCEGLIFWIWPAPSKLIKAGAKCGAWSAGSTSSPGENVCHPPFRILAAVTMDASLNIGYCAFSQSQAAAEGSSRLSGIGI